MGIYKVLRLSLSGKAQKDPGRQPVILPVDIVVTGLNRDKKINAKPGPGEMQTGPA